MPERAWRWCRRNPAMAGLIAAVVVVTVGGFAANTYQLAVSRAEARRADDNAIEAKTNADKAVAAAADAQARADELEDANARLRLNQEQQRRNTYANQMNLIPPTATTENFPQVQNLLAKSRPHEGQGDLRGWEWSYWMRQMHPEATAFRLKNPVPTAGGWSGGGITVPDGLPDELLTQFLNSSFSGAGTWYVSEDGGRIAFALNGSVSLWDAKDGRPLLPKPTARPAKPPAPPANNGAPANAAAAGAKAAGKQADAKTPAPQTGSNKAGKAGPRGGQGQQPPDQDKGKDRGPTEFFSPTTTTRTGALSRNGRRFAEVAWIRPARGGGVANPPPQPATLTVRDLDGSGEPYVESITRSAGSAFNNRVAFNAEADRLAVTTYLGPAGAASCELAVYDLTARQPVVRKGIEGFILINLVAFLPDGRQILVSGSTPAVLANRGGGPASQASRTRTAILDAQTLAVLSEVKMAANTTVAAVSPDGMRLAAQPQVQLPDRGRGGFGGAPTFGSGPELKIIDRASGQELRTIPVPAGISDVCFSADGKRLAGVTPRTWIVHVWDVESGNELYTFRGQTKYVDRIAFTADGTRLVSLCDEGTVKSWDLTAQPERVSMPVQSGSGGRTGPNGNTFTSYLGFDVSRDGRRALETVSRISRGGGVQGRGFTITSATVAVTVRDDQGRVLWQSEQPTTAAGARGPRGGRGTAFSPDGSKLALHVQPTPPAADAPPPVGPQPRPASKWEVRSATGQKICDLQWPNGRSPDAPVSFGRGIGFGVAPSCIFSPDGRSLAIVNGAPTRAVIVFDAHSGQSLAELPATEFTPTNLAFTPHGEQLAIAGVIPNAPVVSTIISIVDLAEGAEWARFTLPRRALNALIYSPDGRWLAGHSGGGAFGARGAGVLPELYVWDMNSEGTDPLVLTGHTSSVLDLAFTPDSTRLASLGRTQAGKSEVKIWDPATGQELLTLTEPADLAAIRFSADGHKLYVFDGEFRRAYDATPLPPATEALHVVDHLPPAEAKAELEAQIAKLKLPPELRSKVTELARVVPPDPRGRGSFGGGPGGFGGVSPLAVMFRPGLSEAEYESALTTANMNIEIQGATGLWLLRKGGALYRLGRYAEAIETLDKARDAWADAPTTKATPAAFLAMIYHRQGQAAKARAELDTMYKELQDNPPTTWTSPENVYRLLLLEAEALVAGKSSGKIEAIPFTERVFGGIEGGRDRSEITVTNAMYFGSGSEALYGLPLRLADQARSLSPDDGSAWLRYGGLLYRVGRYDDAIAALLKARDLRGLVQNAVAAPSAFLAMTYHRQGQADKARAELDRMYTELPNARFNSPTDFYRLFYIEVETLVAGKSSGIIEAMPTGGAPRSDRAAGVSPTAAFRPGLSEADYKSVWEAAQTLKSSTPTSGMGWLRSGGALYRLGRHQEALVDVQKAREMGGLTAVTSPAPTAFLAMTYYRLGQTDKAKEELARLRREMKEPPYTGARVSLTYANFYAEAEAVVEGRPFDAENLPRDLTVGREMYLPNLPEADYRAALEAADKLKTPTSVVGWVRSGGALYRLGQYEAAVEPLLKAREIGGGATVGRLAPTAFLAMTYHRLGQTEKAKQELARLRLEMQDETFANSLRPAAMDFMRAFYAEPAAIIEGKKP